MANKLFYALLFSLSLGQLSRLSFINGQFNFYLSDILILCTGLYTIFRYKLEYLHFGKKYFSSFLLLSILLICSLIPQIQSYTLLQNLIGLSYALRFVLYTNFFYAIRYLFYKKKLEKHSINKGILLFAISTIITSILQYIFFPDLMSIIQYGWDQHLYRMVGTFLDSSLSAGIYGVLIFYFLHHKKYRLVIPLTVLLLLTYSRAAYGATFIVLLWYASKYISFKKTLLIIVLLILAIIIIPKPFGEGGNLLRTSTIQSRVLDYQQGIQIWQENPLWGVGYNRVRYVKEDKFLERNEKIETSHSGASFHSSYILMLATTGIIGFSIFMYSFYKLFILSEKMKYILAYIGILSFADNLLLHSFIIPLLFIFSVDD